MRFYVSRYQIIKLFFSLEIYLPGLELAMEIRLALNLKHVLVLRPS